MCAIPFFYEWKEKWKLLIWNRTGGKKNKKTLNCWFDSEAALRMYTSGETGHIPLESSAAVCSWPVVTVVLSPHRNVLSGPVCCSSTDTLWLTRLTTSEDVRPRGEKDLADLFSGCNSSFNDVVVMESEIKAVVSHHKCVYEFKPFCWRGKQI